MAVWYCQEVIAGKVPACEEEIQGCLRFLNMKAEAGKRGCKYEWSDAAVADVCSFLEQLHYPEGFTGTIVLEPVQCWWVAGIFGFREVGSNLRWVRTVRIWMPRKNAKALALDTPIPTPWGWKTMGSLQVGDQVIAIDGSITRVVDESPIHEDHDCYRVTFSNGEQIVADGGHRWETTARVDSVGVGVGGAPKKGGMMRRVRTTAEIFQTQTYGARGDRNHSLAMPEAMRGMAASFLVEPYVMGAWLGDGSSNGASIYCAKPDAGHMEAQIKVADYEVCARADRTAVRLIVRPVGSIASMAERDGKYAATIARDLAKSGVLGRKYIPSGYLRASYAQRLALLQGLMDTDGTINKDGGCISFTTTSPELRDGVCELLATFGMKFSTTERENVCNGRRLGTPNWLIQFFTTRDRLEVFRMPRKLARMRVADPAKGAARSRSVQITSVERVPSVPVKCIAVDHPSHQFLAGRTMLPTHNTTLSAGIVLYCANFEDEPGAECVFSAGSEDQARIPYSKVRVMLQKDDDLRDRTGANDTRDACEFLATGGSIRLAHARAKNLDGLNPYILLQEELHAQDQSVIGVLKTAQGARRCSLDIGISTAGRDVNAPAFDDWKTCKHVLTGRVPAARMFVVMYAGTEQDKEKCYELSTIEKLNPLYGVALNPTAIEEEILEARKSEAKRQEYLRTRTNIWARAAGNLISVEAWDALADLKLKLDLLKGFPMYVGIDLASRKDLNAAAFLVKVGETLYTVGRYWIGRESERLRDDRFADAFLGWHRDGWLTLTSGSFINYRTILKNVLDLVEGHNVIGFAVDDYQANTMTVDIETAGYEAFVVRKNARSLTQATEDLIARVSEPGLLRHDGNPVTSWCAGNVVGFWDANDNVLPKKESRNSPANIDGIDALILANAIRIDHEAGVLGATEKPREKPNPYLQRGLAGASA